MGDGMLALHTLRRGSPDSIPLVLLHGFPLDHRMWSDAVDLITGDSTILAPDLPGFGVSPAGQDVAGALAGGTEPSIDVMADAVAATLLAAGVTRAVIAGLSMGGYVAMSLAERHPDLLAGLGLLDTKSRLDLDEARQTRLSIAQRVLAENTVDAVLGMSTGLLGADSRTERADLIGRLQTWIGDQGPQGVAWAQRAMAARAGRTDVLRAVGCPSLVVVGEQDETAPLEMAQEMAEALTDVELVIVPGSGHMTPIENPEPVAAALTQLVARALQAK